MQTPTSVLENISEPTHFNPDPQPPVVLPFIMLVREVGEHFGPCEQQACGFFVHSALLRPEVSPDEHIPGTGTESHTSFLIELDDGRSVDKEDDDEVGVEPNVCALVSTAEETTQRALQSMAMVAEPGGCTGHFGH